MKKIYNYHPITNEYIGESTADIDPLESKIQKKEIYLAPANSTELKPPITYTNQVACFESGQWIVKPDFRGQTYYDKETREPIIINFIGNIPENYTLELPILVLSVDKLKENLQNEITLKFQEKINQGKQTSIQAIPEGGTELENIIMDYAPEDLSLFSASIQKIEKIEAGLATYDTEFPDLKNSQGNIIFQFHRYDAESDKHYLFVQSHENKKFYILSEEMKTIVDETQTAYQKDWGLKIHFESLADAAQTAEEIDEINVNYSII